MDEDKLWGTGIAELLRPIQKEIDRRYSVMLKEPDSEEAKQYHQELCDHVVERMRDRGIY